MKGATMNRQIGADAKSAERRRQNAKRRAKRALVVCSKAAYCGLAAYCGCGEPHRYDRSRCEPITCYNYTPWVAGGVRVHCKLVDK